MKTSLPVKLSLWICSILTIAFLAAMAVAGYMLFKALTHTLNEYAITTTKEIAYKLDTTFAQVEMATEMVAADIEEKPLTKQELPKFLKQMNIAVHSQSPDVAAISIAYGENMLAAGQKYNAFIGYRQNGDTGVQIWDDGTTDYLHKEWFLFPFTSGKSIWTVPYYSDSMQGTVLLSYSMPFYKTVKDKKVIAGVVVADITVKSLEKHLHKMPLLNNRDLAAASRTFLMNQFGQIAVFPETDYAMNQTIFSLADEPTNPSAKDRVNAKSIFLNKEGMTSFESSTLLNEPSRLFYASCINGWVVGLAIPSSWTLQIILPLLARFFIAWLGVLAIIIAVIFVICKRINRPLLRLAVAAQEIGEGNFSANLPKVENHDEIGRLTKSFRQMQSALSQYIDELKINVAARERTEGELNAAKAIQQDILPKHLPPFGAFLNIYSAASLTPVRGIGGDLYDVFPIDDKRLAIVIGDVSGKGIPAALFMTITQTLQRIIAASVNTSDALTAKLNDMLNANNQANMFVTYWIGFLNTKTGEIIYTNAGHNPPIIKRANGQTEVLKNRHGMPLGVLPNQKYGSDKVKLNDNDMLILYTDGTTEAFNIQGKMFTEGKLLKTIQNTATQEPQEILNTIKQAVDNFTEGMAQSDDITMLITKYRTDK